MVEGGIAESGRLLEGWAGLRVLVKGAAGRLVSCKTAQYCLCLYCSCLLCPEGPTQAVDCSSPEWTPPCRLGSSSHIPYPPSCRPGTLSVNYMSFTDARAVSPSVKFGAELAAEALILTLYFTTV